MIFSYTYKVRASDCGLTTNMELVGAFNCVEDICSEYLAALGMTGIYLSKTYGVTWVYTKHKMQIFKPLPWLSPYTLKCFLSKMSKVTTVVDFAFYDESGDLAIYSQLEMCLIDLNTSRISALSAVGFDKLEVHKSILPGSFSRFAVTNATQKDRVVVKNSNIDCNNHTNNTEYIRLLLDSYPMEHLRTRRIKSIEVNYINQSRLGEELVISVAAEDNCHKVVFTRGDTQIIKCEIFFDN